jgi:hypothetical protein
LSSLGLLLLILTVSINTILTHDIPVRAAQQSGVRSGIFLLKRTYGGTAKSYASGPLSALGTAGTPEEMGRGLMDAFHVLPIPGKSIFALILV